MLVHVAPVLSNAVWRSKWDLPKAVMWLFAQFNQVHMTVVLPSAEKSLKTLCNNHVVAAHPEDTNNVSWWIESKHWRNKWILFSWVSRANAMVKLDVYSKTYQDSKQIQFIFCNVVFFSYFYVYFSSLLCRAFHTVFIPIVLNTAINSR